jgi:tRNA U34 5-carboxymethylaminomethyl modifying GTPase MnmE/TrmE
MIGYIISGLIGAAIIRLFDDEIVEEKESDIQIWKDKDAQSKKRIEALENFNNRKQEIYNSFSNKISKQLSEDTNFCKEDLNQYDVSISYFNEGVRNIIEIENKENLFPSKIDNYLEKSSKKMSEFEVNHLNVLLVGPSGVGKSCLINSILELDGDKKAEAEVTKPTTKTFNMYESEKKPNIRLIDSRGIEKGDYNIDAFVNEITKSIEYL